MCRQIYFRRLKMPNKETSDLAAQVRKMSIREAINFLADALQERQEMERGEPGPQGVPGKDSTIPGPQGVPGKDSLVQGPQGVPGKSIVGPVGKDGRDVKIAVGSVIVGETASVSLREKDGVQFLDFTLPRGEQGATGRGEQGPQGIPGQNGVTAEKVVNLVRDASEVLQRFAALQKEVGFLAHDNRYHRMDGQRTEIENRLKQYFVFDKEF